MVPGRDAHFPASACDPCPVRTQSTTAKMGQGRSLTIHKDKSCQQKPRVKMQTKRRRASLRNIQRWSMPSPIS